MLLLIDGEVRMQQFFWLDNFVLTIIVNLDGWRGTSTRKSGKVFKISISSFYFFNVGHVSYPTAHNIKAPWVVFQGLL
jgi:trehalose utilization protein